MGFFDDIGDFAKDAFKEIKSDFGEVANFGKDILKTGIGAGVSIINNGLGTVGSLGGKVVDGASGIANRGFDTLDKGVNQVGNVASNLTNPLVLVAIAAAAVLILPQLMKK